jgi:uncharacterized protein YbjT (DUF2867 family)
MGKKPTKLVLVTGATGKQGGAVVRHLSSVGEPADATFRVRALTRDPSKESARRLTSKGVEVVQGDLDDAGSVERALEGADGVFSVQNFWETGFDREVEQGIRIADAAKKAGVEHFVYSSVGSAHRSTGLAHFESKWQIEGHIRALGLPYTILRPVFFMDNWENPALADPIVNGTLAFPLSPDREFQQVAADDIGAFAALAFADPGSWLGREVDLAGDERSMREVANVFAAVIGRPVAYVQFAWDDYRRVMGEEYYKMMRWFEDVGYEADVAALRKLHPGLLDFRSYLQGAGWSRKVAASANA